MLNCIRTDVRTKINFEILLDSKEEKDDSSMIQEMNSLFEIFKKIVNEEDEMWFTIDRINIKGLFKSI